MTGENGRRKIVGSVSAVVLVVLSSACAPSGQTTVLEDADELVAMFRSVSYDYDVQETGDDLATFSDLVVRATVTEATEGPSEREPTVPAGHLSAARFIVVSVSVSEKLHGTTPIDSGDTIYMLLPHTPEMELDGEPGWTAAIDTVLYLEEFIPSPDFAYDDLYRGRPEGATLWQPVGPQGFIAATDTGSISVLDAEHEFNAALESFYPTSEPLPSVGS